MTDLEKKEYPTFKQLSNLYKKYFTLGYINADINLKFALISLIGYIVNELKKKKPDVTYYSVIMKMAEGSGLPEELLLALSIICEDCAYQCTEFPTFGMKPPQMVAKIKEILNMYVPF